MALFLIALHNITLQAQCPCTHVIENISTGYNPVTDTTLSGPSDWSEYPTTDPMWIVVSTSSPVYSAAATTGSCGTCHFYFASPNAYVIETHGGWPTYSGASYIGAFNAQTFNTLGSEVYTMTFERDFQTCSPDSFWVNFTAWGDDSIDVVYDGTDLTGGTIPGGTSFSWAQYDAASTSHHITSTLP